MKYQIETNIKINPIAENLYDVMGILAQQGITFENIKMYNKDVEMIPCIEKATNTVGFYDTIENQFKSLTECLKSFPMNSTISFR